MEERKEVEASPRRHDSGIIVTWNDGTASLGEALPYLCFGVVCT